MLAAFAPMNPLFRRFLPLFAAAVLCGCGVPQPPQCRSVPLASRVPTPTLVAEARKDWMILGNPARETEWPRASVNYNAAVSKLFDQLRCHTDTWEARAASLCTRIAPPDLEQTDPSSVDALFPSSRVNIHPLKCRRTTSGVGVALVGWKKTSPLGSKREKFLLPNGLPHNITAVLAFDSTGAPEWRFVKRWKQEDLQIGSTIHPLAADWSAPNAFYWKMCEIDKLRIQNMILPERFTDETGIYFVTQYDPEKIPIVFVHGLASTPDEFKNMINDLAPEPWFRQKYQIWLYNYPTGNPWLFSGVKFRESMRDACAYARTKGPDCNLKRMVVVTHSMGGVITRASVTNPGTVLYDDQYHSPINQLKVSAETRAYIHDSLLYQPLTEPKRVIFLAVPHRGSPAADYRVSLWISRLIHLPKTLTVELLDATVQSVGDIARGENPAKRLPTSIDSLSPEYVGNKSMAKIPLPGQITFHSVIGNGWKGGVADSSDGVVPYWSSHITPVASELIVPSFHRVTNNLQAEEEVKRILKLHLNTQTSSIREKSRREKQT